MIENDKICGSTNPLIKRKELIRRFNGKNNSQYIYDEEYNKLIPKKLVSKLNNKKYRCGKIPITEILINFNGKCEICKKQIIGRGICIDHNHLTKEVRGLLCINCNYLLGHAQDSIDILQSAKKYLER